MSLRLGMIGAGQIARQHAEAGVATASVDELLALPDAPAAVVAVANAYHKDLAIRALGAGKDVLLEKPMALDVPEWDEVIAAMERTGRIIQVGFVRRNAPVNA